MGPVYRFIDWLALTDEYPPRSLVRSAVAWLTLVAIVVACYFALWGLSVALGIRDSGVSCWTSVCVPD